MKKYLSLILLFNPLFYAVVPYYSVRSQGENAARELIGAGWNTLINQCHMEKCYGNFSITPEYTRSFDTTTIGKKLFGYCGNRCCTPESFKCYTPCCYPYIPLERPCCEPTTPHCRPCCTTCCDDEFTVIHISGSQALNRMEWDWLADYYGLPTDYKSCITFEPVIDNFLIDFNLYLGFDRLVEGLYFKIHAPFVHSRWALHMCEIIEDRGENNYLPGYFNETLEVTETGTIGIARSNLASNFTSFISGCHVINDPTISTYPLCYAKIDRDHHTQTACSDIHMALGYNFFCDNDYHVGFNVCAAAPTGNRPKAKYLFEPIVGNGHHWQAGIGFSAHVLLGYNQEETKRWEFFADANITHLFEAKQHRTFDLCGNPLSRYMLAAKFSDNVTDLQAADDDGSGAPEDPRVPSNQFLGIYTPIANLTTFPVKVSVDLQADVALMLQHVNGNWSIDLGYNFWSKSCENIKVYRTTFANQTWALKGDAFVYGFKKNTDGSISSAPIPLSATQSEASIYNGENNWPNGINGFSYTQNPGIDNRKLAWDKANNPLLTLDVSSSMTHHVFTSLDPTLINFGDIDIYGARTEGTSHKIFAHFDYTWRNCNGLTPYIGLGGELEFGYDLNDNCGPYSESCYSCGNCCGACTCSPYLPCGNPDASNCRYCPLSQWGIWVKSGVAF